MALSVLIVVTTAVLRSIALEDLFARMQPVRAPMMDALGVTEPEPVRYAAFIARADGKFAAHRTSTLLRPLAVARMGSAVAVTEWWIRTTRAARL
jgi:hypothetical protein